MFVSCQPCLWLQVQKIHIGHRDEGAGKGVFVEAVEVTAEGGEPVIFPCRCWLDEDKDDGKVEKVLIPGESLTPEPAGELRVIIKRKI